ncbi:MAG: polysaccharide biosynthesis/export family protein [Aureliella sp.]
MSRSTLRRILLACLAVCSLTNTSFAQTLGASSKTDAPAVANVTPQAPEPMQGTQPGQINRCGLDGCNLPTQPQVTAGLCQTCMVGIDCADNCAEHRQDWRDLHRYNFQPLAHGEYLGPIRVPATTDYRVRVGDQMRFVFILSRQVLADSFPLQVGDELQIESVTAPEINLGDVVQGRGVAIQSDGMIYLRMIGPVRAAGLTIPQLRRNLDEAYKGQLIDPNIDIIPIKTNSLLEEIRSAVIARVGLTGQSFLDRVHPDGTLRLPKVGPICVQGMTLDEIKREVNLRYREIVTGLEVEPILDVEAPHFVFVYGQVGQAGRFELLGPTSVTQALAMAQSARPTANTREIVIFRRAEDWRLLATRVDVRGAHLGKVPSPADEIWLRDGDLIIVPPTPIARFDNFVSQVFTQGIYGVFPFAQIGSGFEVGAGSVPR